MGSAAEFLVFADAPGQAQELRERLGSRGLAFEHRPVAFAADGTSWRPPDLAVVVVDQDEAATKPQNTLDLLTHLAGGKTKTVVWGGTEELRRSAGTGVEWLDQDTSLDEVVGRLSTLARYVPLVRRLERELDHVHRLGGQLNRYFSEIDQEMRLAGRLQRDFLPRQLPDLPGLRCAALYRPASWVSGDMYDAFRIDEDHVGLFLADAMGHGVAAGLLTMFLRQALIPKQISGKSYSIVSPVEAISSLNECLVQQNLPNCQFVTAVYAIYNTKTRELWLARGGHPHPLHIRAGGEIEPIRVGGSLLGLPDIPAEFDELRVRLEPGDKVILFTDGLEEDFFTTPEDQSLPEISAPLREWAGLGAQEFVEALSMHLDGKEGSLHPADDITLLALEVR